MAVGFTIVAMQMCTSDYVTTEYVGVFGMSQNISGFIHNIGAIMGFGAMMLWILCCFTLSDREKKDWTNEKRIRNLCYQILGVLMLASLLLFAVEAFNILPDGFKTVFWTEILMLSFGGFACVIKSQVVLKDK
jgi:hypothetical protein